MDVSLFAIDANKPLALLTANTSTIGDPGEDLRWQVPGQDLDGGEGSGSDVMQVVKVKPG